jgi:hypothetical protein
MVVSLYVCQIPSNVTKEDIINIFHEVDGYIDTRIKIMTDKGKIAFIDFENESNANFAKETLQGFKFSEGDKGLIIKISENSKVKTKSFSSKKRRRDENNNNNNNRFDNSRNRYENKHNRYENNNYNNNNNNFNFSNNNNITNDLLNSLNLDPKNLELFQTLLSKIQSNNNNNNHNNNNYNYNNNNNKNNFNDFIQSYSKEFQISLKNNATNIVYVEGIPIDASEREVSHIFRPFPGFKKLRLINKEKNGENTVLCFVDFENVVQSTICINTLQGYRFSKDDLIGLHFSYGVTKGKK